MKRLVLPLALAAAALLAGCGGTPSATPTATETTSASPSASASPTPTPTPAVVAGFELGGDALYSVEAGGATITEYGFADPATLISALTDFFGAPEVVPTGTYCDAAFTIWPTEAVGSLQVVVFDSGIVVVVVKAPGWVDPTEGPTIGESATAYLASLPPAQVSEVGYVYEPTTSPDFGAAAFLDSAGLVSGLASPSPPFGTGFC